MKTTVPFLEIGHLLDQSYKRRLRLDTDDPILGHVDEHLLEQQAQQLFALLGNRLYSDSDEGDHESPGDLRGEKEKRPVVDKPLYITRVDDGG
ncbi:hypothetical protein ACFLT5_01560 [Chloroflexota bacterium]